MKELLKKYIAYIKDSEGANYINDITGQYKDFFTADEWKELTKLADEVCPPMKHQ